MSDFPDGPETPLLGGDVTEGVVRIGDTVRRPRGPQTELVDAVLTHLERVGFTGAPRLLGTDRAGRQVLSFVAGEVAGRPWPAWLADDARVESVARLVRRFDDAMADFGLPASTPAAAAEVAAAARAEARAQAEGMPRAIDPPPTFVGHLDVTPENVVFVDGVASALIDFDLVRPTDRVAEMCNVLLWWAPFLAPADRPEAVRDVDWLARARLLVDAYGLGGAERAQVVPRAQNIADRSWFAMRARAERLGGGWRRMWDEGVGDQIVRRRQWLAENALALERAIR